MSTKRWCRVEGLPAEPQELRVGRLVATRMTVRLHLARDRRRRRAVPRVAAASAALRYVSGSQPGISRKRAGSGFMYRDARGRPMRETGQLARIRSLAIPPAWTDVWICADPNGHLQATGRDVRGRKQYRYHARWREVRDENKYARLPAFARALPQIRQRIRADLQLAGHPRNKVLALIVQLLETTFIRVGNEEYARTNQSYGLTTMQNRHLRAEGDRVQLRFRGKSGKAHAVDVRDAHLARLIKRCRDIPGQQLFQYVDDDGEPQPLDSGDVNAYLREITASDFTAKDFRTWAGTVLAARELDVVARSEHTTKADMLHAIDTVASHLGNTRAISRKCYIHPAILGAFEADDTRARWIMAVEHPARVRGLRAEERAVIKFLASMETRAARAA